jgi:hypothetical protein
MSTISSARLFIESHLLFLIVVFCQTPLHLLVERRWADLAKWLVYQKADCYMKGAVKQKEQMWFVSLQSQNSVLEQERKKERKKDDVLVC